MPAPIVLLTDFGTSDPYAAQMKGALLIHAPGATIVDLSHEVEPQNLVRAGFLLAASLPHFPAGTVFLAVVDPGVGTARRILCLTLPATGSLVLAPDNGLVSLALALHSPKRDPATIRDCTPAVAALAKTNRVAPTFHGRDLFAPLAGRLALGESPAALGPVMDARETARLNIPDMVPADAADRLSPTVLHVDRFGNAVLSLLPEQGAAVPSFTLHQSGQSPAPLRRVSLYADLGPGQLGILPGSQGFLELAMNQGDAATTLGLAPGQILTLTRTPAESES